MNLISRLFKRKQKGQKEEDPFSRAMVKIFEEKENKPISSAFFYFWAPKTIKNPDRKWYQLWLPRRIANPEYVEKFNDDQVEIDIVRRIVIE